MRKSELEALLTSRLSLKDPRFRLEKAGDQWSGSIVSETFRGRADDVRQKMMWDALDQEPGSVQEVGMLLAYTPEEWDVNLAKAD